MSACNNTASQPRLLQLLDTSPTPGWFKDKTNLKSERKSNLTTTALELIRSNDLKLKTSTKVQLRHKICMKWDVDETKLRRYEETIAELRNRLNKIETAVLHLTV